MASPNMETPSLGGESFAALFEESVAHGDLGREGEIIAGTVVQVGRDANPARQLARGSRAYTDFMAQRHSFLWIRLERPANCLSGIRR